MITLYSIMMVASFTTSDVCQRWTNETYGDKFGYACFEWTDDMYGQFYRVDYTTIEECKGASDLVYGKNRCSKTFIQKSLFETGPPLPRPKDLFRPKDKV